MTIFAVAVFVTAYVLIASEKVHRVTVALGGAAVMKDKELIGVISASRLLELALQPS